MKTKGMKHQLQALQRMKGRKSFGLFMEQGTGKTWCILADAERLYAAGEIDAVLIVAPKGVHTNWTRREIPKHLGVPHVACAWQSGMGKKARAQIEAKLFKVRDRGTAAPLRILSINGDALRTKDGFAFAEKFLESTKPMITVDESSRIKNPKTGITQALMELQSLARYRRIGTGTPITNSPVDVFSQMEFLESGLLETTNFRAFTAEYAELMDPNHPMMKKMIQNNPRIAWAQIVMKDPETGAKKWRNLDKLQRLLEAHTFRVLKRDCLDLPEKNYKNLYFDMSPGVRTTYRTMEKKFRVELGGDQIEAFAKLNTVSKLQQITSGFVKLKDESLHYVSDDNPRLSALLEYDENMDGKKYIVWAHFREEIRAIVAALTKRGRRVVEYHGGVGNADRDKAVDSFQGKLAENPVSPDKEADVFVGQGQSGGIGLTLTAASDVCYFSQSYNLEVRKQTEDRAHRIGTRNPVTYTDIVCEDSIDEDITEALQRKSNLAAIVLGDNSCFSRRDPAT